MAIVLMLCRRSLLSPSTSLLPALSRAFSSAVTAKNESQADEKKDEVKFVSPSGAKKAHVKKLKAKYASNPQPLMEFFDDIENWAEYKIRVGREWRVDDLRLKSNSDLHKLWFVLLKERNMLLTMAHEAQEQKEYFPNPERQDKVDQSMINIETVVRERNKAYMELEVGEGETYERPTVFRPDMFGRHRYVSCSQHLIPYRMNHQYREIYGPGKGKYVRAFIAELREERARLLKQRTRQDYVNVRQLMRRFPNMDMEYLQELYPRVPVKFFKDHLDRYDEVHYISQHATQTYRKNES